RGPGARRPEVARAAHDVPRRGSHADRGRGVPTPGGGDDRGRGEARSGGAVVTSVSASAPAPGPGSGLVVVTGASRGIGRALAEGFADAGHPVLLTARSVDAAQSAAREIAAGPRSATGDPDTADPAARRRVRGVALDVTDPASVEALVDAVAGFAAECSAPLRTLVNNAGAVERSEGPVWEVVAEDMAAVIETNLIGVFRVVRALLPSLLLNAQETGRPVRIIDLNSGSGAQGTTVHAAYSASK